TNEKYAQFSPTNTLLGFGSTFADGTGALEAGVVNNLFVSGPCESRGFRLTCDRPVVMLGEIGLPCSRPASRLGHEASALHFPRGAAFFVAGDASRAQAVEV